MADEKLIFPIGFDLEEGVRQVQKDWKKHQPEIQKTIDRNPLKLKLELSAKGFNHSELKKIIGLSKEIAKANREIAKTRSANALAAQRESRQRVQEATELDQIRQKKAQAITAEERATQAKQRSTDATERQNVAYKTQSGYLHRLFQRMIAYASVAQAMSFLRNIKDVTAEFELQRVALGSIIGDLNEANAMFEQIKAAAVKSPFQIKELVTYTKQLAAYKIETDELFETTQRLADVSAGLGVGMERLVLAYGQIRATGYLRASEVRQLTEAGIPIVEELAKKMSQLRGETVSAANVMQLISERAISFGMVKEVFDDMTSAGGMFYEMQEKQAETLAGQWSNLKDSIAIMYEEIGNTESANSAMKGMIGFIKSLAENWKEIGTVLVSIGVSYGGLKVANSILNLLYMNTTRYAVATRNLQRGIYDLRMAQRAGNTVSMLSAKWQIALATAQRGAATATTAHARAWNKLKYAIMSNPIGLILTAVSTLVSLLVISNDELEDFNDELAKIGTEGALQADQSVRNFERLAKTIRESADGSREQTEALEEMKRAYGEFLPSQDKSIINLAREKDGYNAVTQAIREKIALQTQEQKLSAIASEYGDKISKKETKLWDWLTGEEWESVDTFTKEEAARITNAIRQAVSDGLISADKDWAKNASTISKIIVQQTRKKNYSVDVMRGLERDRYEDFINLLYEMNDQVQQVEWSMEPATGSLGKYTQAYKDFKEELKDVTGTGEKFSFEWNESKTTAEIKAYNEFIGELLAKEGIKFDIGETIDFKDLYEALGDNYPPLKQVVAKIQGEYEKLVPKDLEKLIKEQFSTLATKYGASLDKLQHYFKNADQSTQDWVKTLKDAKTEIGNQIFDAKKLDKDTTALEAQKQVIEEMITAWDNSEKTQKAGAKSAEQALKDELAAVEKIYKRYQDLRKLKSETDTQSILAKEFEGVSLTTLSKAYSPEQMLEVYQKALAEAQRLGKKDLVLEIQTKIGEFNIAEEQRKLEKSLKDLSDKISRTKTAKEFFDKMLGMTGDRELSATLTMSVYGTTGDDLKTLMTRQVEEAFKDVDISSARLGDGKFDYNILAGLIEHLPEEQQKNAQSIVDNWRKTNADILNDVIKSYEDFMTYEERKKQVAEKYAAERKKIMESELPEAEKDKYVKATNKREGKELADIAIEEFKASDDWAKSFEDLENLATPTIERLMQSLREFIDTQDDLSPEQLKTLTNEYQKLYDGLIARNPFKAITDSVKEYRLAIANIRDVKNQLDFAKDLGDEELVANIERDLTDALDNAQKAITKLKRGVDGVGDKFSQAASDVEFFAKALGLSEDSHVSQFLTAMANAFKGVSIAIGVADLAMKLFDGTIKSFLASNPIGWILLIVSAIISAVQAIMNARLNRINDEIEALQDKLDNLEYAYDRLQKSAERAFGTEYIQNYERQIDNLNAQLEAYEKQLSLERSKGKKADEEKIKEYQNQIRDTKDAIEDMYGTLSEHFLGQDLASAARDFASAWIDAYKSFSNTTDAMRDKFEEMIQNMIVESLLAKVMERALEPVFKMVDNMGDSDFYSNSFWAQLSSEMEKATENGAIGAENIMSMFESMGINLRDTGASLTGISKDIATASEESILGLAAGINTQNFYISQVPTKLDTIIGLLRGGSQVVQGGVNMQDLITIQNQHLSYLPTIAQHTSETVAECKAIVVETRRTADALERVVKPRGTQSTHSVNVTIGS